MKSDDEVEARYNEPLYNKVLGITNDFVFHLRSSKIYGKVLERRVENTKAIFPRLVALFSLFRREPLLCQVAVTLAEVLGYSHSAKACPRQS